MDKSPVINKKYQRQTMAQELKIERFDRVTVFTLNRPERHNALTLSLASEFEQAVAEFEQDDQQRVLVITGAGEKAFCSGADLQEMDKGMTLPIAPEQDIMGVGKCQKPVIAAINGLAIGAGFELSLCCDIRLCTESSWFSLPEVARGFLAGVAAVMLPRLMPMGDVMDLMLVGGRLSAEQAKQSGLVQQVLPSSELLPAAMVRAEIMAKHSQAALWGTKQVLRYWQDRSLDEHDRFYRQVIQRVFTSGDLNEGIKAFMEKREPEFTMNWPPKNSMSSD